MKIIAFLACAFLIACAVEPAASAVEQRSTTCVSDPIVAGVIVDGDSSGGIVAQCPPPTPASVFVATAAQATADAQPLYPGAVVPQETLHCNGYESGECWGTLWTPVGNIMIDCTWDERSDGSFYVYCTVAWGTYR